MNEFNIIRFDINGIMIILSTYLSMDVSKDILFELLPFEHCKWLSLQFYLFIEITKNLR